MPTASEHRWMRRYGAADDFQPVFHLFTAEDGTELSVRLREAFAFLRRNADRRYSAQSLMRLLTFADNIDARVESGRSLVMADCPYIVVAETPYEYDEETEVKHGGVCGVLVGLPDQRAMMAVNQTRRRSKIGSALIGFLRNYRGGGAPVMWVHQANTIGQQFCLALGWQPRSMNSQGAIAYSDSYQIQEESMAVEMCDDYELDRAMSRDGVVSRRRPVRARPAPPLFMEAPDYPEDDYDRSDRVVESECFDQGCLQCHPGPAETEYWSQVARPMPGRSDRPAAEVLW